MRTRIFLWEAENTNVNRNTTKKHFNISSNIYKLKLNMLFLSFIQVQIYTFNSKSKTQQTRSFENDLNGG